MPEHLTILEAQQQFPSLPERLSNAPIIITRDGLPVMAAIGYEQLMSLLETLEILSDNLFATQLQQSIVQAEGLSNTLCQGQISLGILPSNSMANRFNAGFQSRIGIVHFLDRLLIAR